MAKPTTIDLAIGERIRENRLARGLSLQDLARAVGVTHQQIQKYERGTCRVSAATLYRLADALLCDVEALFDGVPETEVPPEALPKTTLANGEMTLSLAIDRLPDVEVRQRLRDLIEVLGPGDP
ncbi:helix-turn-helix domain-containing protein [Aureimonas sp. AU12]|uniref:helix-turn-helix domain-containing protein n=1 Tax=Aureimonas sp. AU12 TaxID=1638161 RepID=UPI000B33DBA2|nr:helix-turn-helix transcriptional regulator [Aureimonas sp. AU12]